MHSVRLVVFALLVAGSVQSAPPISLKVVESASLSGQPIVRDIRWADASHVYLGMGKNGVIRVPLDLSSQTIVVPPSGPRGAIPMAGRIAVGGRHLVFASPFGGFGWIPTAGHAGGDLPFHPLRSISDVDARGDRVVVLGADNGPVQGLARDGAIVWIGSLSEGMKDRRPLMIGRAKPGGKDVARCGFLEAGEIRFMRDGSIVVVPGAEPGIYHYDADGRLLQTWETAPLGIIDDCDLAEDHRSLLARDFDARSRWLASRPILDDIVPLRNGPALIIRHVAEEVSAWDLVVLGAAGKHQRIPLPLKMTGSRAHVRADIAGDRLVVLLFEDSFPKPPQPQRVVLMSIEGQ